MCSRVDKAVCTEWGPGGVEPPAAAWGRLVRALLERKARDLRHPQRTLRTPLTSPRPRTLRRPLLLLLPHVPGGTPGAPGSDDAWCECERALPRSPRSPHATHSPHRTSRHKRKRRRRHRHRIAGRNERGARTLVVSAIDEHAKVIQVVDPDELPRRARYTIMVTACLLLFLCLLLVGVTLRMAPLIDDIEANTRLRADETVVHGNEIHDFSVEDLQEH